MQQVLFFSFTTLTTTGYGNLVPCQNPGQTLAVSEMILGQLFLITAMGKIVTEWRPRVGPSRMPVGLISPPSSVTSTSSAPVARSRSAARTCRFTPWAPPPIATRLVAVADGRIRDHGPRVRGAERRDRAAFVAGRLARLVGVGQRQPAGAEVRPQLRPVDPSSARHQHEHVVVGRAPHHDRAQQLVQLDALEARRSPRDRAPLGAHDLERDAGRAGGEDPRGVVLRVAHSALRTSIVASTSAPVRSVSSTTQYRSALRSSRAARSPFASSSIVTVVRQRIWRIPTG